MEAYKTDRILHLLDEMNKHRKEIARKYGLKNHIDIDNIENHYELTGGLDGKQKGNRSTA